MEYDELVYRRTFNKHGLSSNAVAVFRLLLTERADVGKQQVRMTQQQIADRLDVARETVNRRKGELAAAGFLGKHRQKYNALTGQKEITLWDLRPGLTKIRAEYRVSHGKREASIELTADRVTVCNSDGSRVSHGESRVSHGENIEQARDSGGPCDSPPCDKKSQGTYVPIQADEGAPPEGVGATPSPPDEEIVSPEEWKRQAAQIAADLRKRSEQKQPADQVDPPPPPDDTSPLVDRSLWNARAITHLSDHQGDRVAALAAYLEDTASDGIPADSAGEIFETAAGRYEKLMSMKH